VRGCKIVCVQGCAGVCTCAVAGDGEGQSEITTASLHLVVYCSNVSCTAL